VAVLAAALLLAAAIAAALVAAWIIGNACNFRINRHGG
jgi:hypothetical protein